MSTCGGVAKECIHGVGDDLHCPVSEAGSVGWGKPEDGF
jgi:hypothetical protein